MDPAKQLSWRLRLHQVIYESDTPAGKFFDISLLFLILTSIVVVILDSSPHFHQSFGSLFATMEVVYTILFTIEYILRIICIKKPWTYVFSLVGLIDLVAIIPGYLGLLMPGTGSFLAVRALRLLRIFRILKLYRFLSEAQFLAVAIRGSMRKIGVFLVVVLTLVIIMGSVMYVVEEGKNGFDSIPDAIYWAVVTITTVGYGDISPVTSLGKFMASVLMLTGYAIIAVPTGIITTEMVIAKKKKQTQQACPACGREGHDSNAAYCKFCGEKL